MSEEEETCQTCKHDLADPSEVECPCYECCHYTIKVSMWEPR